MKRAFEKISIEITRGIIAIHKGITTSSTFVPTPKSLEMSSLLLLAWLMILRVAPYPNWRCLIPPCVIQWATPLFALGPADLVFFLGNEMKCFNSLKLWKTKNQYSTYVYLFLDLFHINFRNILKTDGCPKSVPSPSLIHGATNLETGITHLSFYFLFRGCPRAHIRLADSEVVKFSAFSMNLIANLWISSLLNGQTILEHDTWFTCTQDIV